MYFESINKAGSTKSVCGFVMLLLCYCLIGLDAVRFFSTWKSHGRRHGSRRKKIVIIHDGLRLQIIDHVIGTGDLLLNLPLRFKQGNGPVALL